MKLRKILLVTILILFVGSSAVSVLPTLKIPVLNQISKDLSIPASFGLSVLQHVSAAVTSGTVVAATLTSNTGNNHVVIVIAQGVGCSAGAPVTVTVAITDNQSNSYTLIDSQNQVIKQSNSCGANRNVSQVNAQYYAITSGITHLKVTATYSNSLSLEDYAVSIMETDQPSIAKQQTATKGTYNSGSQCASVCLIKTNSSITPIGSTDMLIQSGEWQSSNSPNTLGAGNPWSSLVNVQTGFGAAAWLLKLPSGSSADNGHNLNVSAPQTWFNVIITDVLLPGTVTQPLTCTMKNSQTPQATLTLSGGSPSPTTVLCDGSSHNITVNPSITLTATEPAGSSTTRNEFKTGSGTAATTWSVSTCASGTCSGASNTTYLQLNETYTATPNTPNKWDNILSIIPTGTFLGTASSNICTITTSALGGSASCWGWSDNNTAVSMPATVADGAGLSWYATGTISWTDLAGGSTHTVQYYLDFISETFQATPAAPATWDAIYSITVLGTQAGTAGTTICTISTSNGGGSATCSGHIDNGTSITFLNPLADGANTRWDTAQSVQTPTKSSTTTANYYKQLQNTYQASTNGQGPPTWDAGLTSLTIAGTFTGTGSTTLGTLSFSSGTTTTATITAYADYNTAVSGWTATLGGAATNIRWISGSTLSYTDTTGGNTHAVLYYKQLQNTYSMTPTGPTKWDAAYSKTATGTFEGSAASTIVTFTLSNGGGANSQTGYADYNLALSLPSTFASSVAGNWVGTAPVTFTDTTGGNTRTVNYAMQSGQTITNPQGLAFGSTNAGVNQNGTSASFTVDYNSKLFIYGTLSQRASFTVLVNSYVYQEGSQGFIQFSNTSLGSETFDGVAYGLSWSCTSPCKTQTFVPPGFAITATNPVGTASGQYETQSGGSSFSITFQNPNPQGPGLQGCGNCGQPSGTSTNTQVTTTNSEDVLPGLTALGQCSSNPVVNTTTVTSQTTVTYTVQNSATTYTTRIHVDRDDDRLADRNQPDGDDWRNLVIPGSVATSTTTLTQSQVATITYASQTCTFTTTITNANATVTNQTTSTTTTKVMPNPHPAIPPGASNSTNWAGYVIQSNTPITDIKGSWIIPRTSCGAGFSVVAYWVGIDGFRKSNTVEQTGTLSECNGGQVTYFPWYEFYPAPISPISTFTVSSGDIMYGEVSLSAGTWTVTLRDITRNVGFTTTAPLGNDLANSGEWIVEAPSSGGSVLPLAAFNESFFGLDYTMIKSTSFITINGTTLPLAQFPSTAVTLVQMFNGQKVPIATPGPPTNDSTSFIIYGPSIANAGLATTLSSSTVGLGLIIIIIVILSSIYTLRHKKPSNPKKRTGVSLY